MTTKSPTPDSSTNNAGSTAIALPILPAITHGDSSSTSFLVTNGPSINILRQHKAQMDQGELHSCEGTFHFKFVVGETRRLLSHGYCETQLRIDIIDEVSAGLLISGEILHIAQNALRHTIRVAQNNCRTSNSPDCSEPLSLLRPGTRIKLLHRGAASKGALVYIQDDEAMRIHFPHVPQDTELPRETPVHYNLAHHSPILRHTHTGSCIRGIPIRY